MSDKSGRQSGSTAVAAPGPQIGRRRSAPGRAEQAEDDSPKNIRGRRTSFDGTPVSASAVAAAARHGARSTSSGDGATPAVGRRHSIDGSPKNHRRGSWDAPPTLLERADAAAEDAFKFNTLKCAICSDPSQSEGTRKKLNVKDEETNLLERPVATCTERIGLPDFVGLGYGLMPVTPDTFLDYRMDERLDLCVAVHRRTSISRLCFYTEKSTVPKHTKVQDVLTLARRLVQLDHINVLKCYDVAEDKEHLYFLYEYMVCRTLASAVDGNEQATWTLSQAANVSRECCAAIAVGAGSVGLQHLDFSPDHVLLPIDDTSGQARVGTSFAKVFGFGLFGVVYESFKDRVTWSPEVRQAYTQAAVQKRDSVVTNLQNQDKARLDGWSLGTIMYTILEGRLPYKHSADRILKSEVRPMLSCADSEVHTIIDGLLAIMPNDRKDCAQVLGCQWFRKYWRTSSQFMESVFEKTLAFCEETLPQRMFGRFLVSFLDDRNLRKIAQSYYSLDMDGDGVVSEKDLQAVAKTLDRPKKDIIRITHFLAHHGSTSISSWRFAETMAEEVIDGRALRLAFESIDEDGSEEITPPELFDALHHLSPELTLEQVVQHIGLVELGCTTEMEFHDHTLDFEEFCRLFPTRMRRVADLDRRAEAALTASMELRSRFESVRDITQEWIDRLENVRRELHSLKGLAIEKFRGEKARDEAVDGLRSNLKVADHCFRHTPGPDGDLEATHNAKKKERARRRNRIEKGGGRKESDDVCLGFDSFLQEHAVHNDWLTLLTREANALAKMKAKRDKQPLREDDYLRAYYSADAAEVKLDEALTWSKDQVGEYASFVEVLEVPESGLPRLPMSGRGLHSHAGDVPAAGASEEDLMESEGIMANLTLLGETGLADVFRCLCTRDAVELRPSRKLES